VLPYVAAKPIVVRHLIRVLDTSIRVVTKLPSPLNPGPKGLVHVLMAPGSEDQVTARPRIDIHNFAADEATLATLTTATHRGMASLPADEEEPQPVDTVRAIQLPADQYWSDTVLRTVAVYELDVRPA